jgi:virginiamycin B lyase
VTRSAGPEPATARRPAVHRAPRSLALLVGVLVLTFGMTVGTAAASGAGKITTYDGVGTVGMGPQSITAGPDGNLWFTNGDYDSIGRITTKGKITLFNSASISAPYAIAAGSDGALWFTNNTNDSIGRITTTGTVTSYTDPSIGGPQGITNGPRRSTVVHQRRLRLDRTDHHYRNGDDLQR